MGFMHWCAAVLTVFVTASAAAAECGKLVTSSGAVGFCISTGTSRDLLYVFHGATDAAVTAPETQHANGIEALNALWSQHRLSRPTTIAVSWGPIWILKGDKFASFKNEVIPTLEARYAAPGARRLLLGGSMGGFNAYLAWVQAPHLFAKVAFVCPAFVPVSPFASRLTLRRRAGARLDTVRAYSRVLRRYFAGAEEWEHYQPRAQLSRRTLPPAYSVYNREDEFGFTGGLEMANFGQRITYEARNGGHCRNVATEGLARFLSGQP